jgi:hypothetical protein
MLTEFVKKAGVPFRERGGTYFVARSYRLELTAFRELLPLIHRENNIRWMPIAGIGDMDIIARQSLEKEVQSMSHYLDELLDPEKVSETKGSTLKNQLKVYREVEDKTKMLSELLQFRSDALTDKLAKLRQRCLNVLEEISTSTAAENLENQSNQTEEIISELEEFNHIETSLILETTEEDLDNLFDLGF